MAAEDKPLVWLRGEVKTPPFSFGARIEAGVLLRRLQRGENLSLPHALRQAFCCGAYNAEKICRCRIHDQCRVSAFVAMNCEYRIKTRVGGSSVESTATR